MEHKIYFEKYFLFVHGMEINGHQNVLDSNIHTGSEWYEGE